MADTNKAPESIAVVSEADNATHSEENNDVKDQSTELSILLLVDDEKSILKALRRALADDNYHILTSDSPQKALEIMSTNRVAMVISDFNMPGMSGAELLEIVKREDPNCIRIMLSGATDTEFVPKEVSESILHCQKFLTKPWDDSELKVMVKECIEQYKAACDDINPLLSTDTPEESVQHYEPGESNLNPELPSTPQRGANQELRCQNCHAKLDPEWVVCPFCGHK